MTDRERQRLAFLDAAGLADAARAPLPGDASTRRYERLTTTSGATLMLMDQAPAAESQPCDPSWTPEQRHAQKRFQRRDLARNRALREEQRLRSARVALVPSGSVKTGQ